MMIFGTSFFATLTPFWTVLPLMVSGFETCETNPVLGHKPIALRLLGLDEAMTVG